MANTSWIIEFCNDYAPLALFLAQLFIYLGLVMGLIMAAAEAYKVYREAKAIRSADDAVTTARAIAAGPAAGEIIKALVGLLTGAKAWLALVILGIVLLWLAGSGAPDYCRPPEPTRPPSAQQQQQQPPSGATVPGAPR